MTAAVPLRVLAKRQDAALETSDMKAVSRYVPGRVECGSFAKPLNSIT